jgi:hypothetical protein
MSTRILALVGSLRSGSDNRRLAEAAVKLAPSGISVRSSRASPISTSITKTSIGRGQSWPPTGYARKFSRPTRFFS